MITNGFKRKNVPPANSEHTSEQENIDRSYMYSNIQLKHITKTSSISNFCKVQHLKYIAHVTRLTNDSLQKQILFSTDHKRYARNRWVKLEKELNISKNQIQVLMQNKKEFTSFLKELYS